MSGLEHAILGVWTLESYIETNLDTGERFMPLGEKPSGIGIYTANGYMAAQIARRIHSSVEQNFMGYAGTFVVDEVDRRISHHILVSHLPDWIGTNQVRTIACDAKSLELSLTMSRFAGGSLWASSTTWTRSRLSTTSDLQT